MNSPEVPPEQTNSFFSTSNIVFGICTVVVFFLAYRGGMAIIENRQSDMAESERAYTSRTEEVYLPFEHYLKKTQSDTTIIEYIDLECPHCQNLWLAKKEFVANENPDITIIVRHFPLVDIHAGAKEKAVIAECVSILGGEEQFFSFIDTYFRTQAVSSATSTFMELAQKFVPETESIHACLKKSDAHDRVTQSVKLGLFTGIFSTPSFVILDNGVFKSRHDLLSEASGVAILDWLK